VKNISKNFSYPSQCPTTLAMIDGEMISKILHIIETFLNRIKPQNRSQSSFAKQEEFSFVKDSQRTYLS